MQVSNERTQSSGWLWDQEEAALYALSQRVGRMVGLEAARPGPAMRPGSPWRIGTGRVFQFQSYIVDPCLDGYPDVLHILAGS